MPSRLSNLIIKCISVVILLSLFACNNGTTTNSQNESGNVVSESGIVFGNAQGLVFANNTLLAGTESSWGYGIDGHAGITSMVIDGSGNIYAGTSSYSFYGGQVWEYAKGSQYWVRLGSGPVFGTGVGVNSIAITENGSLYTGLSNGLVFVYVTGNWVQLGSQLDNSAVNSITLNSSNNVYAGTANGNVFVYDNDIWSTLGQPDSSAVNSVALDSNNAVYAGTVNGNVAKYESGNWVLSQPDGSAVNSVVINSVNIYAATENGNVSKYPLGGSSWTQLGASPDGTAVNTIAVDSSGNVYAGTESNPGTSPGQVFKFDGNSWTQLNNLFLGFSGCVGNGCTPSIINNVSPVMSIAVNATGNVYAGTQSDPYGGIVYSYNSSSNESWVPLGTGAVDGNGISTLTKDKSGNYYFLTAAPNLFKYVPATESWVLIGDLWTLSDQDQCSTLSIDESGNIYTSPLSENGRIFKYTDGESSWSNIATLGLMNPAPANSVDVISVAGKNGNVYFGALDHNSVTNPGYIWQYNPNNTESFTQVIGNGESGSLDGSSPQAVAVDTSGNLYAGTGFGQVFEYNISVESWALLGYGSLDSGYITSITTDVLGDVYAGTSIGNVFEYPFGGTSWVQLGSTFNSGVPSIRTLTVDDSGNIYAVTFYGTVWLYNGVSWINTGYGNGSEFPTGPLAIGV